MPGSLNQLSWAALFITPLWLFGNGFWLTTVVYLILMQWFWPLALLLSLLFFIKGSQWSWQGFNGQQSRWPSWQTFAEAQTTWNAFGGLAALIGLFWLTHTYH